MSYMDGIDGCIYKIQGNYLVKMCEDKIEKICFPSTNSYSGGATILGTGGNVGINTTELKCVYLSEIKKNDGD